LSFRKIIPLLISQGYGIIAPEMLGYGGTAKPTDVSAYSFIKMADSLKELLTAEELDKVIVLGHDSVSNRKCLSLGDADPYTRVQLLRPASSSDTLMRALH
jgi:hypothetical protein